ncbi:MAG: hypothetical protein NC114_11860, partial [Ruminococcus flavefaciens]|nr:hypothetical protein [Ruminococcus flavefaciens]
EEAYDKVCPHGDAIIVDRQEQEFLGGKAVGVPVDCVNYDAVSDRWVTWRGNLTGDKLYQKWNPKDYRVYGMAGELVVKNGKVKTIPED